MDVRSAVFKVLDEHAGQILTTAELCNAVAPLVRGGPTIRHLMARLTQASNGGRILRYKIDGEDFWQAK